MTSKGQWHIKRIWIQHTYLLRFPKTYNMSRFCDFSSLTFDDLSRPQMTSDPKNSNRFLKHKLSAFQKHSVWKKSKKSFFRSIFKYVLLGWVGEGVCHCTSVLSSAPHAPHFLFSAPHAPHAPHFLFSAPHAPHAPRFLFSLLQVSTFTLLLELIKSKPELGTGQPQLVFKYCQIL